MWWGLMPVLQLLQRTNCTNFSPFWARFLSRLVREMRCLGVAMKYRGGWESTEVYVLERLLPGSVPRLGHSGSRNEAGNLRRRLGKSMREAGIIPPPHSARPA